METTNKPNPERIYATLAKILERKYGVKITYKLYQKSKEEKV